MNIVKFKLFITGKTSHSIRAIESLRHICESNFPREYELTVIDVLENPQIAEDEKIMATPTLIKILPPPKVRIIGDLTDSERVLKGLNLLPAKNKKIEEI